jgi:hypothetical protein
MTASSDSTCALGPLSTPLDLYRANLSFVLRMATLAAESRQRTRELEAQTAQGMIDLLRDAVREVERTQDWSAFATVPGTLARAQAQLFAKFWEGWFGIATQNQHSPGASVGDAFKRWQDESRRALESSGKDAAGVPFMQAMPSMFEGIERFIHAMNDAVPPASAAANRGPEAKTAARQGESYA